MLAGQKRVILFPPSTVSNLYLFPFLHPHATKSQIDVLSTQSGRLFPRFDASKGLDLTLVAGGDTNISDLFFIFEQFLTLRCFGENNNKKKERR
jgi:hypothetical protein